MTSPLFVYNMVGQLITPPYQSVYWKVYGTPDSTGVNSGYFGQLQNIAVASSEQITYPSNNSPVVNATEIQGIPVTGTAPTNGQVLAYNSTNGDIEYVANGVGSFTPANDLSGNGTSTGSHQYVSGLSYSSAAGGGPIGIHGTGTTLVVDAGNTAFSLTQATSTTGAGHALFVTAQAALAASNANGGTLSCRGGAADGSGIGGAVNFTGGQSTSGRGGSVNLAGGTGAAGTGGNVSLQSGSGATGGNVILNPQGTTPGVISLQENSTEYMIANGTGAACNFVIDETATGGFNLTQAQSTTTGGADMTFAAQAAHTGSASTGGRIFIKGGAGDGAATGGYVQIRSGDSASGTGGQIILETRGSTPGTISFQNNSAEFLFFNSHEVIWASTIASPIIIGQTQGAGAGNAMLIGAQPGGGAAAGGKMTVSGGAGGAGNAGGLELDGGGAGGVVTVKPNSSTIALQLGLATSDAIIVGDQSGNDYAGVAHNLLAFAPLVSNPSVVHNPTSGVPTNLAITAQNSSGAHDGGALFLNSGLAGDSSHADGSVQVLGPMNAGVLTFTASNGAQTLTNVQSAANCLILPTNPTGGFTINYLRRIADKSLLFVKNNTSQTATIAYMTGGTVTVATATSALIVSDGSNLVKLMVGT